MSLVSEALRKARQEAAEREGRQRGIPRGLAVPPKRWRSGPGLALALPIALAAAGVGAAITWWTLGDRPADETARVETPVPAGAAQPLHISPSSLPPAVKPPGEAPAAPAGQAERHDRAMVLVGEAQTPADAAHVPPTPATVLAGVPNVSEPTARQRGKLLEPIESARERSFVIDADLGHAKLHLDYIVYRPGSPFAGINGQQVVIGTMIEGLQVDEIGPEFVRLHNDRGTVVLRTH
jgi:hypothetical protein